MAEIAIVGGGPSGAMCGEQLARAGHKVAIFDEHLGWEKPCGGGLTHKAIQCFPFLLENSYPKKLVHSVDLISSEEHRATLDMAHPIVIYSRTVLNGMLLDRAREAGCSVQRSHVMSVDTAGTKPRYCLEGEWHEADFLVLAAGARNQLVPETRPLQRDELEMTQVYFVPQTADSITIKFLPHFEGYIWSFPRCDHLSVGICGSMASHTSTELRGHLQKFVEKQAASTEGAKFYSHVLPSPLERTLSQRPVVGRNWALVGDAAAWVDPLTGEGLFYAIRSGELLGRALASGCPEKYPAWVKAAFSTELEFAARIVRRFLSRVVSGKRGDDAHGAVPAPQPGLPPIDERPFQRHPGLFQPEAAPVGPPGHHAERIHLQRTQSRWTGEGARASHRDRRRLSSLVP